jgi:hypothetical protein
MLWYMSTNFVRGTEHEDCGEVGAMTGAKWTETASREVRRESQLQLQEDPDVLSKVVTLTKEHFQDAFQEWQKHWDRCVGSQGDYCDGDGAECGPAKTLQFPLIRLRKEHRDCRSAVGRSKGPDHLWACVCIPLVPQPSQEASSPSVTPECVIARCTARALLWSLRMCVI